MHGVLIGAILGMGAVCFAGAWRSWRNWTGASPKGRPPRWLALFVIGAQIGLGLTAIVCGLFFLFADPA